MNLDHDAVVAAADLVDRAGGRQLDIGYLDNEKPDWYAIATYRGAKIMTEGHRDPVEACEALARRILEGGKCAHCGGLVTLSDDGGIAYEKAVMADGTTWMAKQAAEAGLCRWRRIGGRWVRGCEDRYPDKPRPRLNRAARRLRRKGR